MIVDDEHQSTDPTDTKIFQSFWGDSVDDPYSKKVDETKVELEPPPPPPYACNLTDQKQTIIPPGSPHLSDMSDEPEYDVIGKFGSMEAYKGFVANMNESFVQATVIDLREELRVTDDSKPVSTKPPTPNEMITLNHINFSENITKLPSTVFATDLIDELNASERNNASASNAASVQKEEGAEDILNRTLEDDLGQPPNRANMAGQQH
jgi:hypothetical protein